MRFDISCSFDAYARADKTGFEKKFNWHENCLQRICGDL